MLSFDDRVTAKPANTNFPAGRAPRLLRSVRASAREHHCNFSTARRNQYLNVNLRDLNKPADVKVMKESSPERQRKAREARTDTLKWPAIEDPLLGKIECPLNSPDFPPVSEKDHLVGRCYCYLCSCAAHLCPGDRKPMRRGTASSRDSSPRVERKSLGLASSQAVEFLSTRQRDFFTFTVTANFTKPLTAPSTIRREKVGSVPGAQEKGRPHSSKRAVPRAKPSAVVSRTLIAAETYSNTVDRSMRAVDSNGGESPAKSASKPRDCRPVTVSVRKRKGEWSPQAPPALKAAALKQFPGPPLRASVG